MKTKREDALIFLACSILIGAEQFNKAFELFRNSENKNPTLERTLNKTGFSDSTLSTVLYELQKIHGITDSEIRKAKKVSEAEKLEEISVIDLKTVTGTDEEKTGKGLSFDHLYVDAEPSDETKGKVIEAFKAAPDDVKQEIRFRDEFPFINDPNLPAELKQLVTDKFSHYHAYAAAHTSLSSGIATEGENGEITALSNDQVFSLAKAAVENFQMDQLIREEFVYYKEHNKVLGVHPIFKQRKLQEVVNLMTTAELSKRAPLLENYIRRDKGKSEAAKDEINKAKFAQKVLDWQFELALVNVRLGISAAK